MPATTIKPAAPAAVLPASAQTISRRRLLTAAGSAALLTAGAALTAKPVRAAAVGSKTLRIAALPAIDALILYAAEADGIFKSEGLNIEILPFKSSVEMTAAIRAEKIIGQYANILGTIAQRANGIGLSLAATTWHTSPAQRAFGFAVSPKFADQITSIEVLKGLTGVSSTQPRHHYRLDDLPHEKCRQSARKDARPNRSRSDSDPAADAPHRENADGPLLRAASDPH